MCSVPDAVSNSCNSVCSSLQIPKSRSLAVPLTSTRILPGLISRCTRKCRGAYSTAEQIEEQAQPLSYSKRMLVCVMRNRNTVNVLHDDVGAPVVRAPTIEEPRDVRMIELRKDLPLAAEPVKDDLRVHPGA